MIVTNIKRMYEFGLQHLQQTFLIEMYMYVLINIIISLKAGFANIHASKEFCVFYWSVFFIFTCTFLAICTTKLILSDIPREASSFYNSEKKFSLSCDIKIRIENNSKLLSDWMISNNLKIVKYWNHLHVTFRWI